MNKCKWTGGKFEQCEASGRVGFGGDTLNINWAGEPILFCPFCGADIRNPEPAVQIQKSGGTWVARIEPVDFICLDPEEHKALKNNLEEGETEEGIILTFPYVWKPISSIEITDEIAKLRPMVFCETGIATLYGKSELFYIYSGLISEREPRLATVDDLES